MRVHPDDRKKKHHAKSRHGCISCKKRHLKCDEGRPGCTRCIKDFGKCEGYQTPRTWLFEPDPPRDSTVALDSSDGIAASPGSTTPPSSLSRQSSNMSLTGSTSPEPEHTRQKRWAPKSRSGCLTCKKRRIKCDEARPSCTRCTVSHRICEYQTPPTSASDSDSTNSDLIEAVISSPEVMRHRGSSEESIDSMPPIFFVNTSPYQSHTEHQTFTHWLGRAESCSVITRSFGSFNILGVELPRLAWDNKSVKHGLLAAASVTASLERFSMGDENDKKATITALKHSSLAINSLLTEDANLEVMVVVAFVFWFMEAWIGSWNRAVMHLASAARMCKEGAAKGQVSEAVAWYVNVCDEAVPSALRDQEFLHETHDADNQTKSQMLCLRLRYGIREIEIGVNMIDEVTKQALKLRPSDCEALLTPLLDHATQMRWLLASMYRKHFSLCGACAGAAPPPTAYPPLYSRVMEQIDFFLNGDSQFDGMLLYVRLKMLQRSIPLFVAGTDMQIRRDAALSIPMKAGFKEEPSPELRFTQPAWQSPKVQAEMLYLPLSSPEIVG